MLIRFKEESEIGDRETLASVVVLMTMHPPAIFDNPPPDWIKLIDGYRHKSTVDFEDNFGGQIWRPKGLKIEYENSTFGEAAITSIPKKEFVWYKESTAGDRQIMYGLTKDNKLIITTKDRDRYWNFRGKINEKRDLRDMLLMVTGKEY